MEPSGAKRTGHWRESKVSVLETYHSDVHHADPDPDVPRCFLDLMRTMELVRGQVSTVLPDLEERSTTLGLPPTDCVDSDPRRLVFEAWRYLKNHADRMRYDEYRCQGQPTMTSAVESVIKQINRRVNGSGSSGRSRARRRFSSCVRTT
jgi:hypothetical protein